MSNLSECLFCSGFFTLLYLIRMRMISDVLMNE